MFIQAPTHPRIFSGVYVGRTTQQPYQEKARPFSKSWPPAAAPRPKGGSRCGLKADTAMQQLAHHSAPTRFRQEHTAESVTVYQQNAVHPLEANMAASQRSPSTHAQQGKSVSEGSTPPKHAQLRSQSRADRSTSTRWLMNSTPTTSHSKIRLSRNKKETNSSSSSARN